MAIYKLKRAWDQASGCAFLDFVLFVNVVPNFSSIKIILRENVVACMSASYVHVFQISIASRNEHDRPCSSSTNAESNDSVEGEKSRRFTDFSSEVRNGIRPTFIVEYQLSQGLETDIAAYVEIC